MQTFSEFLNESTGTKSIDKKAFESIVTTAFGSIVKKEISGTSADLSVIKNVFTKNKKGVANILIDAATKCGIQLEPTDSVDKNGFHADADDVIFLKIKGNDYSDNGDIDELKYDLKFIFDNYELTT